jgi:nucleoside-diphosphate-sugar epimerase
VTPLVILGCGYIGARVARAALADGRPVRVCARSTGRLTELGALGAEIKYLDVAMPKQVPPALAGMRGGTVLYSIPPIGTLPPRDAMRRALQASAGAGASCFIMLSSAGLYGELPDDDVWIDEDTPVALDDPGMTGVLTDEDAVDTSTFDQLRTVVLRLAPVYGPGRGVRARLRKGTYRVLDDGRHAISRIHVDDVARVIFAAEERAPARSRYLVADDLPTTQAEYASWLCERLGLPPPPSRRLHDAGAKVTHRNRRVRNTRLKQDLGLELKYPTFREGEAAIEAEENGQ